AARRAGDRARDGPAGRVPAGLRSRVGASVGQAGRHRRGPRAWGEHCGGEADPRTGAGEPRAQTSQRDSQASGLFLRGGARPPTQEVVAFIDANRDEIVEGKKLGVESICATLSKAGLQVAPSTYYAARSREPSARAQRDAELRPA